MTVPYAFGSATSAIPLSQLDANFNTPITLGNTAIQLGNTVTTLNNMTLANVTITSGTINSAISQSYANANAVVYTNASNVATTSSALTFDGTTLTANALTVTNATTLSAGTANGVAYLNGSKVLTTGSALSWSGSALGIGQASASSSGFSTAPDLLVYNASTANIVAAGDSVSAITSARYIDTTGGGILRAAKYRGTYASPATVQSGDIGGEVRFEVWGGSNLRRIATVNGVVETYTSDTNISGYLTFNTTPAGSTTPSEKMRLDSSGNLGLGVTPSAWGSGYKAYQNLKSSWFSTSSRDANFGTNVYVDAVGYKYIDTAAASLYTQYQGAHSWYYAASGTAGNAITFTQAMTLDASGNLGVGTTSPLTKLDVKFASNKHALFTASAGYSNGADLIATDDAGSEIALGLGGATVRLYTGATERARITSGGDLCVTTTSPVYNSANRGNITIGGTSSSLLFLGTAGTTGTYLLHTQSTGTVEIWNGANGPMVFGTNNTERARITGGGEVYIAGTTDQGAYNLQVNGTGVWGAGAYVNGSDRNLKDNIQSLDSCLDVVMAMRPVTFQYKPEHSKDQSVQPGFIAQELQEAMTGKAYLDGVVQAGPEYLNVAYQNIIPILVKAIQELKAEVAALKGA